MNIFMTQAIAQAQMAADQGEVPVGAVITKSGQIVSQAHNLRETNRLATAHAEIIAIEQACKTLNNWRLNDCSIYVTLEPCPMCMGAILNARIKNVYFGAPDPKAGACGSAVDLARVTNINHSLSIYEGIMQDECSKLLNLFFATIR